MFALGVGCCCEEESVDPCGHLFLTNNIGQREEGLDFVSGTWTVVGSEAGCSVVGSTEFWRTVDDNALIKVQGGVTSDLTQVGGQSICWGALAGDPLQHDDTAEAYIYFDHNSSTEYWALKLTFKYNSALGGSVSALVEIVKDDGTGESVVLSAGSLPWAFNHQATIVGIHRQADDTISIVVTYGASKACLVNDLTEADFWWTTGRAAWGTGVIGRGYISFDSVVVECDVAEDCS